MRLPKLLRIKAKALPSALRDLDGSRAASDPGNWDNAAVQQDDAAVSTDEPPSGELGRLSRLPPFRPVILQLLRLFDRQNPEIEEIGRLADADTSLVSELLTVVNSPVFALKAPVMTTAHAISMLGLRRTQSAVATLAVRAMVAGAPRTATVRRFWTHNIATAVLARDFAPLFQIEGGLAYTAALLHDLGRMGLLAAYPEEYSAFSQRVYQSAAEIVEREREEFQMDHCEAGVKLAAAWKIPAPLAQAIEGHHGTPTGGDLRFLVQLSCRLADNLMFKSIVDENNAKPAETIALFAPAEMQDALAARVPAAEEQVLEAVRTLDY